MLQNARKLRFCLGHHMYLGWLYCFLPSLFGDSRSHVQEIILPKTMFGCLLKLILGFFMFLALTKIFLHNYV
jgi:hypothetical protein